MDLNGGGRRPVTAEDLAAFEALQDPDVATEEASFDWGEDYQRSVLAMLIADRVFLLQSVGLIKPDYFTNKAHRLVADILLSHFEGYRNVPTRAIFLKEMQGRFKDEERLFYHAELELLYDSYEPGIDSRDYHQAEIFNFAKMVALKKAFHRSMGELKKHPGEETWVKIDKWLDEARVVDMRFDIGLDYFGSVKDRYVRMLSNRENVQVFTTGFKPLDEEMTFGGMRRGEMHSFMGPPGVGKSLCLVRASAENVKVSKRVLYISLEMSEDDIAARFDAQLADVDIRFLIDNEASIARSLSSCVRDEADKRLLIVKQFPSGVADVNTIRAYIQQLDMVGWRPDIVVVDYIGEMKDLPGVPLYESRENMVKDLRGFAVENDFCVVTAMQPNRAARDAIKDGGIMDDSNLGDSYGQLRPLDGLYTINQTDQEKKMGVARIGVAKQRSGKSRFTFHVSVDQETLRFSPISDKKYRVLMSTANEQVAENVRIDRLEGIITRYPGTDEEERG